MKYFNNSTEFHSGGSFRTYGDDDTTHLHNSRILEIDEWDVVKKVLEKR